MVSLNYSWQNCYISDVNIAIDSIQRSTDHKELSIEECVNGLTKIYGVQTDCLNKLGTNDFKASFTQFIDQIIVSCDDEDKIRFYSLRELKETVEKMDVNDVEDSILRIFTNHNKISSHVKKIIDLSQILQADGNFEDLQWNSNWLDKVKDCYNFSTDFFASFEHAPLASETLFCLHYGIVRKEWLNISRLFQNKVSFCVSHANDPNAPETFKWPLDQKPIFSCNKSYTSLPQESVAFMACNWGSGHKIAVQNAAEVLEKHGMVPVSVDIADEMLKEYQSFDAGFFKVQKTVGFNFLLQNKAFSIINLLRGEDVVVVPKEDEIVKSLRRLLLINPSLVIESISTLGEPIIAAAQIIGIPVMHITTDVDRSCPVRSGPPEYSYFRACIPFDEEYMMPKESTKESKEQIAVLGPPVKESYDSDITREIVEVYKQEIQSKYGVEIGDKKLVIITNGSNGTFSPYPQMIADLYAGRENVDFVCVVLCGKGNSRFASHVQAQANRLNAGLKEGNRSSCMYALEFVEPQYMHKLLAISSYGGGVIGKAGGMTTFEICKAKTRAIFDDLPPTISFTGNILGDFVGVFNFVFNRFYGYENIMPWEKHNQQFAINARFASVLRDRKEFEEAFSQMLKKCEPENNVPTKKFSEELPKIVKELTESVKGDIDLKVNRKYIDDPNQSLYIIS